MEPVQQISLCLTKGFKLINSRILIVIFGLILIAPSLIPVVLPVHKTNNGFLQMAVVLLSFIFGFINLGFLFSRPLFYKNKVTTIKDMLDISVVSSKKIIPEVIKLSVILTFAFTAIIILLAILIIIFNFNTKNFFQELIINRKILFISSLIFSFTAFTECFVALKNYTFIKSIKSSFLLMKKNIYYLGFVYCTSLLFAFINYYCAYNPVLIIISQVITYYLLTVISAASYFLFLEISDKK